MNQLDTTPAAHTVNTATGELTLMMDATAQTLPAVPLAAEAAEAWRLLPKLHGTVRMPELGAPWTAAEYANAAEALRVARTLIETAKAIETAVTEGYLTDADLRAQTKAAVDHDFANRLATTARNSRNHYVLGAKGRPFQTRVPGTDNVVLSAEYSQGAPQISVESLAELRERGVISRREFKRLTKTTVVVDTEALTQATGRDPQLTHRLRDAWKTATPRIAVHLRTLSKKAVATSTI